MTGHEDKARRARGDGGVHWDARRQRFIAEQTVGYNTMGKRVTRKASGKTEAAALRELRKRVRDHEAGLVVGSEHYRVKQAVEDWLDNGQGRTVAATQTRNRHLCNTHVLPKLGGRKVRDLRAEEVDAWLEGLTGSLATSTIGRVKSCLSRAVRRAMKRGYVDRNVVDLCDVPEGRKGRPSKSLTLAQARDVLTKTKADPLHCYIVVSLVTGARTEELRALRWEEVHLEAPAHVDVWRSVRATGDTKTPRSRRSLALPGVSPIEWWGLRPGMS